MSTLAIYYMYTMPYGPQFFKKIMTSLLFTAITHACETLPKNHPLIYVLKQLPVLLKSML